MQKIRRTVRRTKATNQRTRKVDPVEDNVEDVGDIAADTVVDTMYPKEDKVAEESVTRSHLTKMITPRTLGLGLGIIQRIVSATINVPFAGRRAITRQTVDSTRGTSQFA